MATPYRKGPPITIVDGWDRPPEPVRPLPGQVGLFEYRQRIDDDGQVELFDTGRDLPGAEERDQSILWDVALEWINIR